MALIRDLEDPDTYHRFKEYQGSNSITHCGRTISSRNVRPAGPGGWACKTCYASYRKNLGKPPAQKAKSKHDEKSKTDYPSDHLQFAS
jgi:hypothetical protein